MDQALLDAAPAERAAWIEATRLAEAARSAHLEGAGTTETRIAALEADSALGLVEPEDRLGLAILTALRSCDRLASEAVLTPAGLSGLLGRARRRAPDGAIGAALSGGEEALAEGHAETVPDPAAEPAIAAWLATLPGRAAASALPALAAVALAWRDWGGQAPFGPDSGLVGRLLVPVLVRRVGATAAPVLCVSERLAARPWRAGDPGRALEDWLVLMLTVFAESAEAGRARLATLRLRRARWQRRLGGRRGHSRLAAAADVALGAPLISGRLLVERLGVSPRGATLLINQLAAAGVVEEVSGRSRFRLYAPTR